MWKKAGKGFYIHKALELYRVSPEDRVTKRMFDADTVYRSFLIYKYTLELYKKDFKSLCPKAYIIWAVIGVYFANLSSKRLEILKILRDSFKASGKYALIFLIPWAIFSLISPRSVVKFLYEKIFKTLKLDAKIKNLFLRS